MYYYIQGCAAKADKIKAAFERLGYDTSFVQKLSASDSHILFTLPCDTRVHAFHTAYIEADILKRLVNIDPGYTELELPIEHEFKVGDWVVKKDGKTFYGGNYAVQITSIEVDEGSRHIWLSSTTWVRDNDIRLWTIADAKDGDVLATGNIICIFKKLDKDGYYIISPCIYTVKDGLEVIDNEDDTIGSCGFKPATKEDRELLFRKIQEAGYEWDADKKELLKTIKPKFKVGDDIKTGNTIDTIAEIDYATHSYYCESGRTIWFENQDLWHLVAPKPHYNIANFHAGMPVLVRADNDCSWDYSVFSRITGNECWPFAVCNGVSFTQCIPFEGNEHLLGTTDMCDEQYINW